MNPHSFSLSSIGMTKGRAQVKLDGEDISDAVSGVGLDFSAREHPRVMLELTGVSADVAVGEAEIQLPTGVRALLQRLGWKTPKQAEALDSMLDAAHGLIVNAHQKRIDDVTNADGASSGWAEAARRWVDTYPPGLLPVPNSDETSGEVSPDAVGRVIT
jgi:hypothetical protein